MSPQAFRVAAAGILPGAALVVGCGGGGASEVARAAIAVPSNASSSSVDVQETPPEAGAGPDSSVQGLAACREGPANTSLPLGGDCIVFPSPAPLPAPSAATPARILVPLYEWAEQTRVFQGDRVLLSDHGYDWTDAAEPLRRSPLPLQAGLRDKIVALEVTSDRLLAWEPDGSVHALSLGDGAETWRWSPPQPAAPEFAAHLQAILVDEDLVIDFPRLPAEPSRVFALDAHSGALLWSFRPRTWVSQAAAMGDVLAVVDGDVLIGLDARTGAPRWEYANRAVASTGRIVARGGAVLWRVGPHEVHVIDTNGRLLERRVAPDGFRVTKMLASGDERACVQLEKDIQSSAPSRLLCADAATGADPWSWPPAGKEPTFVRGWWSFRNLVVVQATDDGLIGLDALTGAERWRLGTTAIVESVHPIGARGGGIALTWVGERSGMFAVADPPPEAPVDFGVTVEGIVLGDPDPNAAVTVGTKTAHFGPGGTATLHVRTSGSVTVKCRNNQREETVAVPRLGGAIAMKCSFGSPKERTKVIAGVGSCSRDADCRRQTDCCGVDNTCSSTPRTKLDEQRCARMGACARPSSLDAMTELQFMGCVCQSGRCASRVRDPLR